MTDHIKVTKAEEIALVSEFVEQHIKPTWRYAQVQICSLISEELTVRLLGIGCREINVSVKGLIFKYVEIRAEGVREDTFDEIPQKEEDRIDHQINSCLLEQYADKYSYRYQKGVNLYRVYPSGRSAVDLTDEIYGFYKDPDPDKPIKPGDILWHIARDHAGFFFLSVVILLIRHLGALMLPVFASRIINTVSATGSFFERSVIINIILSVISLAVNLTFFWLDSRGYRRFAREVEAGFRMALVQKLQVLSIQFHKETQSGVVLSKLASDMQFIEMLIYDRFMDILFLCEDVLFIFAVALTTFPLMLAFYIVIVPAVAFLINRFSRPLQESRAGMRKKNEQVNAATKEMLELVDLTRSQGLEKTEYRNMLMKIRSARNASVIYDRKTVSVNNITYGGFQGLRLLSLSFAALLMTAGYINVGTLVLFQSIFDLIINNVQRLLDSVPLIVQGYDSLVSVNEIMSERDKEENGTVLLGQVRGEIEFRHVSFGYGSDREPVLNDISFKVPAGGSIAFVGRSGQGKSTILNLILGLYSADSGEILIDGINIDELEKTAYRHNIAIVPQNTVLFSGTLWDNLVYGLSYVSTEKVMNVLARVGLDDLVAFLPDGLYTHIPENGSNLSGGQRQRISVARALLRDPKIILLDEATSALDGITEKQVQGAVDALMGDCTVIMVSHRPRTLRHAQAVYMVENGTITKCDNYVDIINEKET